MVDRTRLFRAIRSIPYAMAILFSIISLVSFLLRPPEPFEGSYLHAYVPDQFFYAFMFFLLAGSLFVKGVVRSVLVLICCTSIFSTGLIALFRRMHDFALHAASGEETGSIVIDLWIEIGAVGLFFLVVVIEAVTLVRSRPVQP